MKVWPQIAIGTCALIGIISAMWLSVYLLAFYAKARALTEAKAAVVETVDSERIQNYLKDHCAKHPEHLRCAAIR